MRYGLIPKKPGKARVAQSAKAHIWSLKLRVLAPLCIIFFLHSDSKKRLINQKKIGDIIKIV